MWRKKGFLLLVIFTFSIQTTIISPDADNSIVPKDNRKTKISAHRGGKGLFPENTLYAYQQAVSRWHNCLLEGDIQITADNIAVLIHDATIDRTTNGQGAVKEKTLNELKALDAGYKFSNDGGKTFPYRGKGITIPTLDEVLEALPEHTFLFEIKSATINILPIVEPILKRNMQDRVYLASMYPLVIEKIRKEYPQIKTCFTVSDSTSFLSALRGDKWDEYIPPAQMLAINDKMESYFNLNEDEMKKIKEKGIQIVVFSINSIEKIRKYINSEVNWILTDYPDRVEQLELEAGKNTSG